MKKACIALLGLCFAGMASALTMGWQWTAIDKTLVEGSSFYMVYSQNQAESVEQVVAAASGNKYGATTPAIGSGWGSTLNTEKDVDLSGFGNYDVAPKEGATTVGDPVTTRPQVSVTFNSGDNPMFGEGVAGTEGYLYFVIFNNRDVTQATQFAVGRVDGTVGVNNDGQLVIGGQVPSELDFYTPVWMGGTHRAAPEPTALALLALGIAGVALRRRVR